MGTRIRGRWCGTCNGKGHWGNGGGGGTYLRECCDCHWVGFVGVTSDEVRQAEIEATLQPDKEPA